MLQLYKDKIRIDKSNLPASSSIGNIVSDWKEDKATKTLMYIYLMHNRSDENPIKDFQEQERSHRAREISFGDASSLDTHFDVEELKLLAKAIKEYEDVVVDKIQKDIDLYDKKMYEFIDLLDKNKPEIRKNTHEQTLRVSFSTNIDIITTVLDNAIDIILDKAALTHLKKTGKWNTELRGGLSPHIKGKIDTDK